MKFTSEDLMKAMGLQVGDKIKIGEYIYTITEYYTLKGNSFKSPMDSFQVMYLVDEDFEILPRPKRIGDLKCDKECNTCPLRALESCNMFGRLTLYELLEKVYNDWENKDQEVYALLKARLDKEVII